MDPQTLAIVEAINQLADEIKALRLVLTPYSDSTDAPDDAELAAAGPLATSRARPRSRPAAGMSTRA